MSPEETQQSIGILKKNLNIMTQQDLQNKIATYQPPNQKIIKMPVFNQIFKIDEKVRLACFIELCRQSDNFQGFDPKYLFNLMERPSLSKTRSMQSMEQGHNS